LKFRKRLVLSCRLRFTGETPIIVYQMGKVGSSSVVESLQRAGMRLVFHVHRMNPHNIQEVREEFLRDNQSPLNEVLGETLYRKVIERGRKAKFITLVREPIGRNISAFFENFSRFTDIDYEKSNHGTEELIDIFINRYNHEVPLTWFDVEMRKTLGIDVYKHAFPKEKGYLRVKGMNSELLILKLETDDLIKEKAITEFLDTENFTLARNNVGREKVYSQTYQDFIRTLRLPRAYVELMCNAAYTRHFYSEKEIDSIQTRWGADSQEKELPPGIYGPLSKASFRGSVSS